MNVTIEVDSDILGNVSVKREALLQFGDPDTERSQLRDLLKAALIQIEAAYDLPATRVKS